MRKISRILITTASVLALTFGADQASAQPRYGYGYGHGPVVVQHNYYGHPGYGYHPGYGAGIAGAIIGGAIIGGALAPRPYYAPPVVVAPPPVYVAPQPYYAQPVPPYPGAIWVCDPYNNCSWR
jgi:hypothetical protein